MTTTAIKTAAREGKKMTKTQKLKVLKDTRKMLEDPKKWTKGSWYQVTDESGDDFDLSDLNDSGFTSAESKKEVYIHSKHEHAAMCILGALGCAVGLLGTEDPDEHVGSTASMHSLASCSIASIMIEALPEQDAPDYFYAWRDDESEQRWQLEHDTGKSYPDTTEGFAKYLEDRKQTAAQWFVEAEEDRALEMIYEYNDDSDRTHEEILALLDTAISNLEAK